MSTENLNQQDAIEKLKEMVNHIDIGMFSSFPSDSEYPHTIPMSRQEIDKSGNIWFLFSAQSDLHQYLTQNSKASIAYSHVGDYQFLSLNGRVEISQNQDRIGKYWNKFVEAWFEKGKEDPNIRVLKFIPYEAHYWDNKTNKLMTLLKVASSAITGQKTDIGREGELEI